MRITQLLQLNEGILLENLSTAQLVGRFLRLSHDVAGDGERWGKPVDRATFNAYATAIIRRIPEVAYQGRMYRGITLPGSVVRNCPTKRHLEQYILTTGLTQSASGIASWASTIDGCLSYMNEFGANGVERRGYDDPYYAKKTVGPDYIDVVVIYEQQGRGVDYKKLRKYVLANDELKQMGEMYGMMLTTTSSVDEILAQHNNTLRLGLITIEGLGDKLRQPKDDWGKIKTHYADRTTFRPDDYELFFQALTQFLSGQKPRDLKRKTKPHSDASQYNSTAVKSMSTEQRWKDARQNNEDTYGNPTPRW